MNRMSLKRSKHGLDLEQFNKFALQLAAIKDPEMVLLKAHMLVERVLVQVLAARLREPDAENVPRLPFDRLADLAIRKAEERRPFIWFNELRNALAHEFDALGGKAFTRAIGKFEVGWTSLPDERRELIGVLADLMLLLAWQQYFNEMSDYP